MVSPFVIGLLASPASRPVPSLLGKWTPEAGCEAVAGPPFGLTPGHSPGRARRRRGAERGARGIRWAWLEGRAERGRCRMRPSETRPRVPLRSMSGSGLDGSPADRSRLAQACVGAHVASGGRGWRGGPSEAAAVCGRGRPARACPSGACRATCEASGSEASHGAFRGEVSEGWSEPGYRRERSNSASRASRSRAAARSPRTPSVRMSSTIIR